MPNMMLIEAELEDGRVATLEVERGTTQDQIESYLGSNRHLLSEDPYEDVYDKDRGATISAPVGMPGDEIQYHDSVQNLGGKPEGHMGYTPLDYDEPSMADTLFKYAAKPIDVTNSLALGVANITPSLQKFMIGTMKIGNEALAKVGMDSELIHDAFKLSNERLKDTSSKLQAALDKNRESVGVLADVGFGVGQLPEWIGAASIAGPVGLFSVIGADSFVETYNEALVARKTEDKAFNIGLKVGGSVGALNAIYIGRINTVIRQASSTLIRKAAIGLGLGAAGEGAEFIAESAILNYDDVREDTPETFFSGLVDSMVIGGLTFAAGTAAFSAASGKAKELGIENFDEVLSVAKDTADGVKSAVSKAVKDDVAKLEANPKIVTEMGDVYQAAQAGEWTKVGAFLEEKGLAPEQVAEKVAGLQKAVDNRRAQQENTGLDSKQVSELPTDSKSLSAKLTEISRSINEVTAQLDQATGPAKIELEQRLSKLEAQRGLVSQRVSDSLVEKRDLTPLEIGRLPADVREKIIAETITPRVEAVKEVMKPIEAELRELEAARDAAPETEKASFDDEIEGLQWQRARLSDDISFIESEFNDIYVPTRKGGITERVFEEGSKALREAGAALKLGLEKALTPVESRVTRINKKIGGRFGKFQGSMDVKIAEYLSRISPFLTKYKSLSKMDRYQLDLAMKNADQPVVDQIARENDMEGEIAELRSILNEIKDDALAVGLDFGSIENFYPRLVKDSKGLINHLRGKDPEGVIGGAIDAVRQKMGVTALTMDQQAEIANRLLRGLKVEGIKLSDPNFLKRRRIATIDPILNEFYQPSVVALGAYINNVVASIEQRRFLSVRGAQATTSGIGGSEDSVGAYLTQELIEGNINPLQEAEIKSILNSRFNQKAPHWAFRSFKNIQYVQVLGSFKNALTQFGDLYQSVYKNGFINTGLAISDKLTGANLISKKELNIDAISAEFTHRGLDSKFVDLVFTANFLKTVDGFGKEVFIGARLREFSNMAKKDSTALREIISPYFGPETDSVIADLASGNISQNVKILMGIELGKVQPTTMNQMTQLYLDHPNGRIFYMLKTFTIRHLDLVRTEVIDQAKTDKVQASKNLMRLAGLFIALGATIDEVKDFIFGNKSDLSDTVIDNMLKFVGSSKYQSDQMSKKGPLESIKDIVDFPDRHFGSVRDIPIIGEPYYQWYEKDKKDKKSKSSKKKEDTGFNFD